MCSMVTDFGSISEHILPGSSVFSQWPSQQMVATPLRDTNTVWPRPTLPAALSNADSMATGEENYLKLLYSKYLLKISLNVRFKDVSRGMILSSVAGRRLFSLPAPPSAYALSPARKLLRGVGWIFQNSKDLVHWTAIFVYFWVEVIYLRVVNLRSLW